MYKVLIVIFILCSVTADAEKMLKKLGSVCKVPEPELEKYLYLQVFSREDESMYRVKVTEERVTSTFRLSAIWTPRTLMSIRGDFICFGRYNIIVHKNFECRNFYKMRKLIIVPDFPNITVGLSIGLNFDMPQKAQGQCYEYL